MTKIRLTFTPMMLAFVVILLSCGVCPAAVVLHDDDTRGLVESVETSLDGGNAVWLFHTRRDLPVDPIGPYDTVRFELFIDADRKIETGVKSADIPFLAFGADRVITVTAVAGKEISVETTGISPSDEKPSAGGGPDMNELQYTIARRSFRLLVPLSMIGVDGPSFSWLLTAGRPVGETTVQVFKRTAVRFDTGETIPPLILPPGAVSVQDPGDAKIEIPERGDRPTGTGISPRTPPSSDLTRLDAALLSDVLMARITYEAPITMEPAYLTGVFIRIPGPNGTRDFYIGINRQADTGGQAVLFETTPGADSADAHFIQQCLATRSNQASLLLPASLFGQERFDTVELHVETRRMSESSVPGEQPRQNENPSQLRYGEHQGFSPGIRTSELLDRLPDTGEVKLNVR